MDDRPADLPVYENISCTRQLRIIERDGQRVPINSDKFVQLRGYRPGMDGQVIGVRWTGKKWL